MPSRFLRSLPPGIVDEKRTTSLWAPAWGAGRSRRPEGQTARRSRDDVESWSNRPSAGAGGTQSERPVEEASQDAPRYVKGERVRHRRFGSGTIQGLTGTGRDLKVSVAFDDEEVGVKQLLVTYAGLEREWESA
jgi:DNA helicase-2/ATP-dependent DNA helicase PcrA